MGLLRVGYCSVSAHLCSCLPSPGLVPGLPLGITFLIFADKESDKGADCRISPVNGSETLRMCFHPLYRCTCRRGYVGDGSTCYGNIMERLKELNTEPRGTWQGRLTSFISLLGTRLWVQISALRATLFQARPSARCNRSGNGRRVRQGLSLGISPSQEGSCRWDKKKKSTGSRFQGDKQKLVLRDLAMR